jgi:hypothetical protein
MDLQTLVPVISATGFGVQQFLQVACDPVVSILIDAFKNSRFGTLQADGTKMLPKGISDVDAKKALLGAISILLGIAIAWSLDTVRILKPLQIESNWDVFITGLTISAGTEGANSLIKLLQYVKDVVKTKTAPSVAQNSPVPQAPSSPITSDPLLDPSVNLDA